MSVSFRIRLCIALATLAAAIRLDLKGQATEMSRTSLRAGSVLRSRYVLQSFLYSDRKGSNKPAMSMMEASSAQKRGPVSSIDSEASDSDESISLDGPEPGKSFPATKYFPHDIPPEAEINKYVEEGEDMKRQSKTLPKPVHWGTGSFGDVWKAFDQEWNVTVAVKIFFEESEFLTPKLAEHLRRTRELNQAKHECQVVLDIMKEAAEKKLKHSEHICRCWAEHISDAGPDDPVFLSMEMCGQALDDVLDEGNHMDDDPPTWARYVMKGVLEGIHLLTQLNPPRIHHDLKLGNVAVSATGHAKLIDWGAVMEFKPGEVGGVCTPQYVPPEVYCAYGPSFRYPPEGQAYEFDTFSAGLMYHELICQGDRPASWFNDDSTTWGYGLKNMPRSDRDCKNKSSSSPRDRALIDGLMNKNPNVRMTPEQAIEELSGLIKGKVVKWTKDDTIKGVWSKNNIYNTRLKERHCRRLAVKNCKQLEGCVVKRGGCHKGGGRNRFYGRKKKKEAEKKKAAPAKKESVKEAEKKKAAPAKKKPDKKKATTNRRKSGRTNK